MIKMRYTWKTTIILFGKTVNANKNINPDANYFYSNVSVIYRLCNKRIKVGDFTRVRLVVW